ncbi:MAG: cation diffusion facilitator CzcD-associated flavoprotein CzcO [Gammaproteobacteria bacterium]|jgi:cation diffusion facilitator CzcD-associated flavoprotein CzcO
MSKKVSVPVPQCLAELEAMVQRDLQLLNYPPNNWVVQRSSRHSEFAAQPVLDVIIIGAGMCGLSAAFALLRRGVRNLRVVDRNAAGFEGPWLHSARMRTLRSPKHLTGPAQGLPNLTCRAWFEAQWGAQAWQELGRIPRTMWMDYLCWFRTVLALPVDNQVNVRRIVAPQGASHDPFTLELDVANGKQVIFARKVVLASGRDSMATPRIPEPFGPYFDAAGTGPVQHSSQDIDFARLRKRTVAVLGIGASAMDNAACALDAGAARVHLLARAHAVPRINKAKGIVYGGFTEGFPHLPDAQKLRRLSYIANYRVAPPRQSVLRVASHHAFELHMGTQVQRVERRQDGHEGGLILHTAEVALAVDHVILATGFGVDLSAVAQLRDFQQHIARWHERVQPSAEDEGSEFLQFPYLGDGFQFTERQAGSAPYLRDLYCFNFAAAPSHGNVSGDIPAVSEGAERLANGIVRHIFVQDAAQSWQALQDFNEAELLGDEFEGVSWWPPLDAD